MGQRVGFSNSDLQKINLMYCQNNNNGYRPNPYPGNNNGYPGNNGFPQYPGNNNPSRPLIFPQQPIAQRPQLQPRPPLPQPQQPQRPQYPVLSFIGSLFNRVVFGDPWEIALNKTIEELGEIPQAHISTHD